jgi:hypothetical protein
MLVNHLIDKTYTFAYRQGKVNVMKFGITNFLVGVSSKPTTVKPTKTQKPFPIPAHSYELSCLVKQLFSSRHSNPMSEHCSIPVQYPISFMPKEAIRQLNNILYVM